VPHFFFRTGFRTQISLLFFFLAFSLSLPPQNRSPKMSGLVGEFVKGLRGLKVKELAPYVGGYARTNLTPGALYGRAYEHIHLYKKHLDQGSVKPLFDTMGLLFVGAYALAWPTVRMEGEREREDEGFEARIDDGLLALVPRCSVFICSTLFFALLHVVPSLFIGPIEQRVSQSRRWRGEKDKKKESSSNLWR
jgi:hypothetical protein